ncbi:4-oxalocrotonate tautomerase [Variovorax sp. OV329]|uniref:tautomerase family protein n=1 Tax=Variovorax sp. OV329 TaxID=1882825 RepID=UPI0008E9EA9A|nr:4-oxalocrotonate tautomerase [Variovorax sp. OV329]SFM94442.1 Phenylpyruvate tautomerase PptA, 4-oxalocrotonate tautomerase family [Variovorax sp. OV329]
MPIMQVQYGAGQLDTSSKAELARRLTDVLIRMEGGANTHGGRAFAWVMFSELPESDWWVGGAADDGFVATPGKFLVTVTIPEGYMNAAHKNEVHAWVAEALLAATHTAGLPGAGASILVVIDEVTEGNWSAAGQPISLERIADSVGLSKDGERFAWSRQYFEAKVRMLDAAGYPRDAGGVMPSQDRS